MRDEIRAPWRVRIIILICTLIAVLSVGSCLLIGPLLTPAAPSPDPVAAGAAQGLFDVVPASPPQAVPSRARPD
jgi:hypothetical protein